jgi:hypothetical protein
MGAFSVALSAWAVTAMTTYSMGTPDTPADSVVQAASLSASGDVLTVPGPTHVVGGFRMEGSPELEVVFGDTASYRRHVDRFYTIRDDMDRARTTFTRHVQAALLAASRGDGRCPTDVLAPLYSTAHREGETYRKLGAKFEQEYVAITNLDRLGETTGLTPDYRWKVNQIRGVYSDALVDYKEMRISFFDQLASELQARGCSTAKLLEQGEKVPVPDVAAVIAALPGRNDKRPARRNDKPVPIVPASTVTFFIDNTGCGDALRVYVDGTLLGEVAGSAKTAVQALAGRHMLCLLDRDSVEECGDPSTVRESYIHDGWSIRMQCRD